MRRTRQLGRDGVKKFDITFRGEVLPKHDPERVKAGFVELFKIRDSGMLEEIFSGEPVVLRSNLDRKAAAEYFVKVNQLGAVIELVTSSARFNDQDTGSANATDDDDFTPHPLKDTQNPRGENGDILVRQPGLVDRIWPVSAARMKRPQQQAETPRQSADTGDKSNGVVPDGYQPIGSVTNGDANHPNAGEVSPQQAAVSGALILQSEPEKPGAADQVAAVAAAAQKIRKAELEQAQQEQPEISYAGIQVIEEEEAELSPIGTPIMYPVVFKAGTYKQHDKDGKVQEVHGDGVVGDLGVQLFAVRVARMDVEIAAVASPVVRHKGTHGWAADSPNAIPFVLGRQGTIGPAADE